jgi:uncharacterized protein
MRSLLLLFIRIYQVYLSPFKGFRCAYHIRTGRRSCSKFGFAAIDRLGVVGGLRLLRRRFRKCAYAADIAVIRRPIPTHQTGHCDLPLGDCNFGHGCHASDGLDCASCGGCGGTERAPRKPRQKRESAQEGEID